MHRSGTSLLAGTLIRLGAPRPKNEIPASPSNERGFYESVNIRDLNQSILQSLGSDWDSIRPIDPKYIKRNFTLQAEEIIRDEYGADSFFVLKDPRICRLFPFWQEVFSRLSIECYVITIIRNPSEVASSLLKRNGIPEPLGRLLWMNHVLDAEFYTRGCTRSFVLYDRFLVEHRKQLERLLMDLGLEEVMRSSSNIDDIDSFVDRNLRHFTHNNSSFRSQPDQQVFTALTGLADKEDKRSLAILDVMRTELGLALKYAGDSLEFLRTSTRTLRESITESNNKIARLGLEIEQLSKLARERQAHLQNAERLLKGS